MSFQKKILIISNSIALSGAELSLIQYLNGLNSSLYQILIVVPKGCRYNQLIPGYCEIAFLRLTWFQKSYNPIYLLNILMNVVVNSFKLASVIRSKNIELIYSNSIKAHIYGAFLNLLTPQKTIWHVRDNIRNGLLYKFLIRFTDKIICVSDHIYKQIEAPEYIKKLIYGGIDVNEWQPLNSHNKLRESIGLSRETKLIAQIGQITYWKNHFDFIKAAAEIIQNSTINVHFLIVGDDLTGKEKKYKKQLEIEILKVGLEKHFSFLGFNMDIKEIYAQIDVLVHPAIDEPFGRVIIEAMSMEIPVVAYDCGGPKEIIINNKTGYLVEPYQYKIIAEKVKLLLKDENLQIKFGKEGRKRVVEKFNITEHIFKMQALFDSI